MSKAQAVSLHIESLAKRIRAAYIRERTLFENRYSQSSKRYSPGPYWDGGDTRFGTKRSSIWERLAVAMDRAQVDPEGYVHSVFSDQLSHAVQPNQLMNQGRIDAYCARRALRTEWWRVSLRAQTAAWRTRLTVMRDPELGWSEEEYRCEALLDETADYSVLFRYCLAASWKLRRVMERYADAAVLQYLGESAALDEAWGAFIPESLRQRAEEVRHGHQR